VTSLQQGSAPGKSKMDSAGEREILIHSLRLAVARSRLVTNVFETVGVSLRHKQITPEAAMEWLRDEGLLSHIEIPGAGK
jgi:hypothetical protein